MLTCYSVPRRFEPPFDTIQQNAVRSWRALGAQVILLGDGETAGWAARLGAECAVVETDRDGVPYVRAAIEAGERLARGEVRCFLNTDNIALPSFGAALAALADLPAFVAIGRRADMAVHEPVTDFGPAFEARVRAESRPGGATGMDFFAYRGVSLADGLPDTFRIGRDFYDNWLVRRWAQSGVPLVDLSAWLTIVHQDHPRKPTATPEQFARNRKLADLDGVRWGFAQATHRLTLEGTLCD